MALLLSMKLRKWVRVEKMIKLSLFWVVLSILFLTANSAYAGKLYKIVDEKTGKVTYSQFPPKEKSASEKVEDVEISDGSTLKPIQEGDYVYCGDLSVGGSRYYREKQPKRYVKDLNSKIKSWEKQLNYVKGQLNRADKQQARASTSNYSKYESSSRKNERYGHYQETKQREAKRIKQYNCAIAWAKGDIRAVNEAGDSSAVARAQVDSEIGRLEGLTKKHTKEMYRMCGEEPVFDPTTARGKKATLDWKKCARPYKRDMSTIEGKIRAMN